MHDTLWEINFYQLSLPASGGDSKEVKAEGAVDKDKEEDGGIGALADMLDNLDSFVVEPTPQGAVVKCRITRDRKGMDRGETLIIFFTSARSERRIQSAKFQLG